PERYAQWERVQDPDYRTLLQYANRFDLPRETVARAYDAKRQAELYRQALDANPNLTDEQRAAAVRALVRETEAELDRILGRKAGRNYRRSAGWLQALSELPAPANANP
ncbi:MAG TPA: hypothetical protein VNO52_01605, partial [Methylomirabilota bacterium]|nr:hypothetical protein [Methylomirabilota bacterium]